MREVSRDSHTLLAYQPLHFTWKHDGFDFDFDPRSGFSRLGRFGESDCVLRGCDYGGLDWCWGVGGVEKQKGIYEKEIRELEKESSRDHVNGVSWLLRAVR